ncbi:hypothetical protein [Nocardioides solisilvae]|uniref:hypothetical protein n=1 Tax=Nocardioides solisilvae TaxID=1542435 RepID=UPI000D750BE1|nr:hypothetical protein [Nocardioides solisilvae]
MKIPLHTRAVTLMAVATLALTVAPAHAGTTTYTDEVGDVPASSPNTPEFVLSSELTQAVDIRKAVVEVSKKTVKITIRTGGVYADGNAENAVRQDFRASFSSKIKDYGYTGVALTWSNYKDGVFFSAFETGRKKPKCGRGVVKYAPSKTTITIPWDCMGSLTKGTKVVNFGANVHGQYTWGGTSYPQIAGDDIYTKGQPLR